MQPDLPAQRSYSLTCHSATPSAAIDAVQVACGRVNGGLRVDYALAGRISQLRVPVQAVPARRDELWRHLCCELFLRLPGEPGYREFNFAPSSEWAAYSFSGYRLGMAPLPLADPPAIAVESTATRWRLQAQLSLHGDSGGFAASAGLAMSCCVVIEELTGALSYWALRHPSAKPDFHHGDGFIAVTD